MKFETKNQILKYSTRIFESVIERLEFYNQYKDNPREFFRNYPQKRCENYDEFKDLFSYYGRGWKNEYNDWLLYNFCFKGWRKKKNEEIKL